MHPLLNSPFNVFFYLKKNYANVPLGHMLRIPLILNIYYEKLILKPQFPIHNFFFRYFNMCPKGVS